MTAQEVQAEFNRRKRNSLNRRQYVEDCTTCDDIRLSDGFGPYHDASERCESSYYEHCSCDRCF